MVHKRPVLLWVEHLQQRAGRVATHVPAQLVDLVQQDERVAGAHPAQGLNQAPRHGGDVCAPVPPNLSLITDAAQGDPHKGAAQGVGNAARQAGFAHPWGAKETQDSGFGLRAELTHRQVLHHPLLHLVQAVVLRVQHRPGGGQGQAGVIGGGQGRLLAPRHGRQPLHPGPASPVPRALLIAPPQLAQLLAGGFQHIRRWLGR